MPAQADKDTFVGLAKRLGKEAQGDELWVLAPAFIATELREAFAIAVLIFLPFLVIDLVVGLGLAASGCRRRARRRSRCRSSCCCSSRSMGGDCCSRACCGGTCDREPGRLVREGVLLALLLAAPLLVAALIAGVLSGLARGVHADPGSGGGARAARGRGGRGDRVFAPAIAHQLEAFASRLWPLIAAIGTG